MKNVAASLVLLFAFAGRGASVAAQETAPPATPAPASTSPNVVIDGTAVQFDQPPIQDAGRIFVPLRGVFERLGASVVFAGGQINATSGSHTIGLHVGQPTATIDGQTQTLESPPILVGGRVLVPLRFIATALGASVNFDAKSQTAYIVRVATPAPPPPPPTTRPDEPTPPAVAPPPLPSNAVIVRTMREEPATGSTVPRLRPEVSASFSEPIAPNSARITLDGRDVSADTYVNDRSFVYDPTFDLPAGPHDIVVVGKTTAQEPFQDRWSFTTGTPGARNYLSGIEPPNGITVASPLVISGITRPHARVTVLATSSDTIAHFSEVAGGSASTSVSADDHGIFEARLELVETGAGILDVRITSTTGDGGVAVKTLRLRL